jgi:hypothetical protein
VRNFNQRHRQLCNSPPTEIVVVVIQRRLTPFLPNSSGFCSRWVATAPQINPLVNGGRFEKIQIDFFFLLLKNDPPNSNRNLLLGLHDHNLNSNRL